MLQLLQNTSEMQLAVEYPQRYPQFFRVATASAVLYEPYIAGQEESRCVQSIFSAHESRTRIIELGKAGLSFDPLRYCQQLQGFPERAEHLHS